MEIKYEIFYADVKRNFNNYKGKENPSDSIEQKYIGYYVIRFAVFYRIVAQQNSLFGKMRSLKGKFSISGKIHCLKENAMTYDST